MPIDTVQSMKRVSISSAFETTRVFGRIGRLKAVKLAEFFFWPFRSKFWPFFLCRKATPCSWCACGEDMQRNDYGAQILPPNLQMAAKNNHVILIGRSVA
jgi:hypothetical protein